MMKVSFLHNLKWEDLFLIRIFEVGRHTFNPDVLMWEDPPLIGAIPSAGSLYMDTEERGFALGLLILTY